VIRVILSGATGRVGAVLTPAIEADPDLQLVARAAPSLELSLDRALADHPAEVVVDFTVPDAVEAACRSCIAAGVPLVLGTSGMGVDAQATVDAEARAAGVPLLFAPNFAVGAVLMMRFAEEARRHMPSVEIVELHADTKRDAPSGTALETARRMGGEVPIHSVRLEGLVAHQAVIFGGPGQTLTVRHDTSARDAFVPGVLLAVKKVAELPPGLTVGLEAVM